MFEILVVECYSLWLLWLRIEDRIDFLMIKKDGKGMLVMVDINIGE